MQLIKREDGWWIINVPSDVSECGPYDTKAEAADDMRGLKRFFKYENDPTDWTTDSPPPP